MVKKINSSEFEQVKNNKAIIVDFSAEWCGPCKMLAPVMEQLSDEITDVEFYNIDVDENPDLAREYRIMNIPAVMQSRAVRLPVSRLVLCLRMI